MREGAIFVPRGISKLVRNPPILEYAKEATIAHSEGKEFYLNNGQIEKALEDSADLPKKSKSIPTNRFSEEEITVWAFGYTQSPINPYNGPKKAQNYGDFLYELGTKSMPIWRIQKEIVDQENKPFARPLYFKGIIAGKSALIANDQDLHFRIRVRGIRDLIEKEELIRPLAL